MGFGAKAGSEFEYYLLTDTYEQAWRKGYVGLQRFGYYNEDYVLLQATKGEPIHGKLRNLMTQAGIPIEFSKGEAAPGQHEVNIHYDDVLEMADQSRALQARRQGDRLPERLRADLHGQARSHLDRLDRATCTCPLGPRPAEGGLLSRREPSPTGWPTTMRHFLGGMMKYARELAPFFAPNMNSYKRYAVASWAPVNVVWGRDNRTTGFRIVGDGIGPAHREPLPRRRHEPVPHLCLGASVPGCWASSARSSRRTSTRATATWPPAATACRELSTRQSASSRPARRRSTSSGPMWSPTTSTRHASSRSSYDAIVHPWDRERYLERG